MTTAQALLAGAVDYAGLFPPAGLGMAEAVRAYASYRLGPQAWMLGRFVVPAARLDELYGELAAAGRQPGRAWRLSALLGRSLRDDADAITRTNRAEAGPADTRRAIVDACEVSVDSADAVGRVAGELRRQPLAVSYEIDPAAADRASILAAVKAAGGSAKIRTGGIVPEAIPPAGAVAAFVWDCLAAGVRFKATAGLHHPVRALHPLRYDSPSPAAVMHGFVNLFAATILGAVARESGTIDAAAGVALLERILAETDPAVFRLDRDGLRWRERHVARADVARLRAATILSFGSCSFAEPVAGLEALGVTLDPPAGLEDSP